MEGPFAWRSAIAPNQTCGEKPLDEHIATPTPSRHNYVSHPLPTGGFHVDAELAPSSLNDLQEQASALGCIAFKLPKWNVLAGRALVHSVGVMNSLFKKHDPCIFKVGITHNPGWRWSNPIYGYSGSWADKWTNMLVFYASDEPHGPSMLESALIEKYRSIWTFEVLRLVKFHG